MLAAATAAGAQPAATTATLSGTITDVTGKPLGGARVRVTSANASQVVLTGPDGAFHVSLPVDTYAVSVSDNGFQTTREEGVTLTPSGNAPLRIALANASLTTIGRVATSGTLGLNTEAAATTIVTPRTFADQGQPQTINVLDQIPGIEIIRSSSNAPGANSSISIRGAQPYESQVLIDGHPVVTSANGAYGYNSTFTSSLLLGNVEIDQGPGSLPNTIEDAVGGTLNFKTPTITGGPTATALVGYDSFNGNYYGLKLSDTFGKVGVLLGVAGYETPGYLAPTLVYGGAVTPTVTPGTAYVPHTGVVNFAYPATQDYQNHAQLAKLSYDFSPQTSLLLENYSTQSVNDETGTNLQSTDATIVPSIGTGAKTNFTYQPYLGLVGQNVPINLYAPYPNTSEFDNAPIYSGEFRTVIGSGSFLARYYTGAINRIITQKLQAQAVSPCTSPACPSGEDLTANPPDYGKDYDGEPYVEDTIDVLHGVDAQYTLPFGNDSVTVGFDRHVDDATFGSYDPTQGPPAFNQGLGIQSIDYNLRGTFALTPKLTLQSGNYFSSTTYVGSRFDPRDGLVYRVNPSAAIRASYGSAYVAPYYGLINTAPYVDDGTLNLATTTFKPETSSGYDLGADVKPDRETLLSVDGYLTNIFNRYAGVTVQQTGTFGGKPYSTITQQENQANAREEGIELQALRAPRIGFGFHSAAELLRDYAYHQSAAASFQSVFGATSADYVQLPKYPYSKFRNDLFYTFGNGVQTRVSATTYGANNAFGQNGFTEFDGQVQLTLLHSLLLNLGATNVFNHDDYRAGGIYDGGYTYRTLAGGPGYTTYYYVQPRTLFIQLQRAIGPSGTVPVSRAPL